MFSRLFGTVRSAYTKASESYDIDHVASPEASGSVPRVKRRRVSEEAMPVEAVGVVSAPEASEADALRKLVRKLQRHIDDLEELLYIQNVKIQTQEKTIAELHETELKEQEDQVEADSYALQKTLAELRQTSGYEGHTAVSEVEEKQVEDDEDSEILSDESDSDESEDSLLDEDDGVDGDEVESEPEVLSEVRKTVGLGFSGAEDSDEDADEDADEISDDDAGQTPASQNPAAYILTAASPNLAEPADERQTHLEQLSPVVPPAIKAILNADID